MTPGQHHAAGGRLLARLSRALRRPATRAAPRSTGAARCCTTSTGAPGGARRRSFARASGRSTWARRCTTASRSSPRTSASGLRSTCPRAPPPRACFSPTTTSCSPPTPVIEAVSYEAVSYLHTRALEPLDARRPARGHRPAGRRQPAHARAGADAVPARRRGRGLRERGARVPAQRRLRVLAGATAARGATRSMSCCSARARASAVTTPRPSSP